MDHNTAQDRFDLEKPLLYSLSKLSKVIIVPEFPYKTINESTKLCFLDSPAFAPIPRVLRKFKGNLGWTMDGDLPRTSFAIFQNPAKLRGFYSPLPEEAARLETQSLPEQKPIEVSITDLMKSIASDVPLLADFIERSLELASQPSLGIEFFDQPLDLPLMDDYLDVNSVADVSLVADPDKYFNQRRVTSPFDRRLHFWLSSHEYEALFDELEQRKVKGDLIDLPMLQDIASQGGYGTQLIQPSSVDDLAWECLQIAASSGSLETALHKIRSVCSSALNYHLGILIRAIDCDPQDSEEQAQRRLRGTVHSITIFSLPWH